MSWLFGAYGNISDELLSKFKSAHGNPQNFFRNENFYIACGGPEGTYHFKSEKNDSQTIDEIIAVSGIGIKHERNSLLIMDKNEWLKTARGESDFCKIDGHYCGVYFSNGKANLFTDPCGVYDLHYYVNPEYVLYSTELFLLNLFLENSELNAEVFASRWSAVNQLSGGCIINGINRLSKGDGFILNERKKISCKAGRISNENNESGLDEILSHLIDSIYSGGYSVSLSLSGGIDSRLLLALLASNKTKNFTTHSFGNPVHPDSVIASKIAKDLGIRHTQLNLPMPSAAECIKLICDYIKDTACINSCSNIFQLRYYPMLNEEKTILIDGGFGEIGRRNYLNKLLYSDKAAIFEKNSESVFRYISLNRADIFNDELNKKMREYSVKDIAGLFQLLPDAAETGAENWADIFSIHTRLPEFFGIEQQRIGKSVINLMPFGLKKVLDSILKLPVKRRKSGKGYKSIILENCQSLSKYYLVKKDSYYPFKSGTIMSRIFTETGILNKRKIIDNDQYEYLNIIREFVLDLLNSLSARNCGLYDFKKIEDSVKKYYNGEKEFAAYADWWLSFEILRRHIYKTGF